MADQQLVTKQRFSSSNQRFSLEVTQMDCDALGRVSAMILINWM